MREFDLLRHIYTQNPTLPGRVTIPPGDDMGAVRLAGGGEVLVTVDQVADGVHFDLRTTPLEKIARKAITRNLSDVAAMAAAPVGAVVAACLPRGFSEADAEKLSDMMRQTAARYDCPLFGGDVSVWDHPMILTVTVLAEARGVDPILRRGAKVGDAVCVTGRLGGSLEDVNGYTHHLDFEPRLSLARRLASDPATRPNCMIDLSDGLARDLGHLCRAASVSAVIEADRLPISAGGEQASRRDGRPAWMHAVGDGEDYELCFTIDADRAARLPREINGVPVTVIGRVVAGGGAVVSLVKPGGETVDLVGLGWEHHGK
ncbi:MAG: thiamine-phosphate kinase [Planctomycetes bacterium]|nr:thiamine-phosphate kinase [Planctomycetota bacterium]